MCISASDETALAKKFQIPSKHRFYWEHKLTFNQTCSNPSDKSPPLDVSATNAPKSKSRKKLYTLLTASIVIVIILVALIIPQGSAVIPLNVEYEVGEKMVYQTATSVSMKMLNSTLPPDAALSPGRATVNGQEVIEVIDFQW